MRDWPILEGIAEEKSGEEATQEARLIVDAACLGGS